MSNLTTTTFPTLLPTYTNSTSLTTTPPRITTSTAPNGDVQTITEITVVQPTDNSGGNQQSGTETGPLGPTSTGLARRARSEVGVLGWAVVGLAGVGVVLGFM